MASTFDNDLRLEEMATGENAGSWGTKTNTNLELIADAFGYGTFTIADADTTLTMPDGSDTDNALRSLYLKISSSADLTTTRTLTLAPNSVSKLWYIENNTSGGQTITISQGSGANVSILNGQAKLVATDGAGATAAVIDVTQDLAIPDLFIDDDLSLQSDGAIINFGEDADITLTHTADTSLTLGGAGTTTGLVINNTAGDGDPFLSFALSGTQTFTMGIDDGDSDAFKIGTSDIGTNTRLSISSTGNVEIPDGNLTVAETDAGAAAGPFLNIYRNSASPANDDFIGSIAFQGNNSAAETIAYSTISTRMTDVVDGSEDARLDIQSMVAGTVRSIMQYDTGLTQFNAAGQDIDFRVQSDGNSNMLYVDADTNRVGIGTNAPDTTLHVNGTTIKQSGATADITMDATNDGSGSHVGTINVNTNPARGSHIALTDNDGRQFGIKRDYSGGSDITSASIYADDATNEYEVMTFSTTGVVINNESADIDFRVKVPGQDYMFWVDAGNDKIGINTSTITPTTVNLEGGFILGTGWADSWSSSSYYVKDNWLSSLVENGYGGDINAGIDLGSASTQSGNYSNTHRWRIQTSGSYSTKLQFVAMKTASDNYNPANVVEDVAMEITGGGNLYTYASAIFNEDGENNDFRIESLDEEAMFFVDADANEIGIGTSDPTSTLDVVGRIESEQFQFAGGNGASTNTGRIFGYSDDNSASAGATWLKLGVITLPDASFSSITLFVKTTYYGSNYGQYNLSGTVWNNQVNVTRKTASVVDAGDIHGPKNNKLQLHRNNAGEWELQGRAEFNNQAVNYEIVLGASAGGASFVTENGSNTAGSTGGTTVSADGASAYSSQISYQQSWSGAEFNAGNVNSDFKVRSDNRDFTLFVDASSDRIGINDSAPQQKVSIIGGGSTSSTLELCGTNNDSSANDNSTISAPFSLVAQVNNGRAGNQTNRSFSIKDGGSGYSDGTSIILFKLDDDLANSNAARIETPNGITYRGTYAQGNSVYWAKGLYSTVSTTNRTFTLLTVTRNSGNNRVWIKVTMRAAGAVGNNGNESVAYALINADGGDASRTGVSSTTDYGNSPWSYACSFTLSWDTSSDPDKLQVTTVKNANYVALSFDVETVSQDGNAEVNFAFDT